VVGALSFNAFPILLPLFAERTFDGGPLAFTTLFASLSFGSLLGGLAVARRRDVDLELLVVGGSGLALCSVALAAAPLLVVAVAVAVPVGYFGILVISGSNAVAQLDAAPSMRGRVLALFGVVFLGSTPVTGPVVGWVAQGWGPRAALAMGGVASAAVTFWMWSAAGMRKPGAT
jgi:hypothetical protein